MHPSQLQPIDTFHNVNQFLVLGTDCKTLNLLGLSRVHGNMLMNLYCLLTVQETGVLCLTLQFWSLPSHLA